MTSQHPQGHEHHGDPRSLPSRDRLGPRRESSVSRIRWRCKPCSGRYQSRSSGRCRPSLSWCRDADQEHLRRSAPARRCGYSAYHGAPSVRRFSTPFLDFQLQKFGAAGGHQKVPDGSVRHAPGCRKPEIVLFLFEHQRPLCPQGADYRRASSVILPRRGWYDHSGHLLAGQYRSSSYRSFQPSRKISRLPGPRWSGPVPRNSSLPPRSDYAMKPSRVSNSSCANYAQDCGHRTDDKESLLYASSPCISAGMRVLYMNNPSCQRRPAMIRNNPPSSNIAHPPRRRFFWTTSLRTCTPCPGLRVSG